MGNSANPHCFCQSTLMILARYTNGPIQGAIQMCRWDDAHGLRQPNVVTNELGSASARAFLGRGKVGGRQGGDRTGRREGGHARSKPPSPGHVAPVQAAEAGSDLPCYLAGAV